MTPGGIIGRETETEHRCSQSTPWVLYFIPCEAMYVLRPLPTLKQANAGASP